MTARPILRKQRNPDARRAVVLFELHRPEIRGFTSERDQYAQAPDAPTVTTVFGRKIENNQNRSLLASAGLC